MNATVKGPFAYDLCCYSKENDSLLWTDGPYSYKQMKGVFGLRDDEYPGDCLEVTAEHIPWFAHCKEKIDLTKYDYFVEIHALKGPQ